MRIEWTLFAMNDREAIFDYLEADSPRTPYIAAYRIERETVTILRVLHGGQEWPEEMEPGGDTENDSAT